MMSDKKNCSLIIFFLLQRFITQTMHNTVGAIKLVFNGSKPAVLREKKKKPSLFSERSEFLMECLCFLIQQRIFHYHAG